MLTQKEINQNNTKIMNRQTKMAFIALLVIYIIMSIIFVHNAKDDVVDVTIGLIYFFTLAISTIYLCLCILVSEFRFDRFDRRVEFGSGDKSYEARNLAYRRVLREFEEFRADYVFGLCTMLNSYMVPLPVSSSGLKSLSERVTSHYYELLHYKPKGAIIAAHWWPSRGLKARLIRKHVLRMCIIHTTRTNSLNKLIWIYIKLLIFPSKA